ncbi:MAG: hypothetical protein J6Q22_19245 [Prevotella sp.]|nr:hypothetical protein [Prevotella sp.]
MKKNLFYAVVAIGMLASCADNEYVGEIANSPNDPSNSGEIVFGLGVKGMTRGDIYGNAAAELLGNNFYVTGTKGTEADDSPTPTLVFDNYLVHYGVNTAGTTESNTANWEYVGVTPGTSPYENYVKLSALNSQTIKYWDFSADQYDFLAFSTGTYKAVETISSGATDEVGVTAMKYGADLANSGVAYTFDIPSEDALSQVYISDITEVPQEDFGKEVQLKFKSLGSKVRVALYETVPGYSVKDVKFYTVDGTTDFGADDDTDKSTNAALIFTSDGALALNGQIDVIFPSVGTNNEGKADYNVAAATVTAGSGTADKTTSKTFGALKLVAPQADEATTGNVYLGRSLPTASFAGTEAQNFYTNVFPVNTNAPITLRVNYTLVPIDGAAETIEVKGAKAVVPATYTKWLPNYAYTYIFKISDNTNGWTGAAEKPSGLFPITFDAVVAEATDATGEQATITTVATPTITTYQQNHDITKDEYSKATAKDIYVQVMDNSAVPATLKGDLNGTTADATPTNRSLLYAVTGTTPASEALVMDALENQSSVASGVITGRNGVILTPATINAAVTSIVNGPDDNPITVTAGQAAKITITGNDALDAGTYAYVYDYSDAAKVTTTIYQPIAVTTGSAIGASGEKFLSVATTVLDDIDTEVAANVTTDGEAVDKTYIYFSKTKNGTSSWTYSFVSVDGKATLPAGLVKCSVSSLTADVDGTTAAVASTFYFTTYVRNNGSYAVKIIKIVAS